MDQILYTPDPVTGITLMQQLTSALVMIISTVLGLILSWIAFKLKNVLPAYFASIVDEKNMVVLHSAAMTAVRNVLVEGGDPQAELQKILEYMKKSAQDAFTGALKTRTKSQVEQIFKDIAMSKIPLAVAEFRASPVVPVESRPE